MEKKYFEKNIFFETKNFQKKIRMTFYQNFKIYIFGEIFFPIIFLKKNLII